MVKAVCVLNSEVVKGTVFFEQEVCISIKQILNRYLAIVSYFIGFSSKYLQEMTSITYQLANFYC